MVPRVHQAWAVAVHEALAAFPEVLVGQIVPGPRGYELVLTTRRSPPPDELEVRLRKALAELVAREDSPLAEAATGEVGLHFYPAHDERGRELLDGLNWRGAVVLHEWVDD